MHPYIYLIGAYANAIAVWIDDHDLFVTPEQYEVRCGQQTLDALYGLRLTFGTFFGITAPSGTCFAYTVSTGALFNFSLCYSRFVEFDPRVHKASILTLRNSRYGRTRTLKINICGTENIFFQCRSAVPTCVSTSVLSSQGTRRQSTDRKQPNANPSWRAVSGGRRRFSPARHGKGKLR